MRRRSFLRDNGLSLALAALFALMTLGQAYAGYRDQVNEQRMHHELPPTWSEYLHSGAFGEAIFENWESEFLQMTLYVVLTSFLFQRGSAESNDPDEETNEPAPGPRSPALARASGRARTLYAHSLSLAFAVLFAGSMVGHALCGAAAYNEELASHGLPGVSTLDYVSGARFWFESLQNWQSEFLAMLAIVLLTIWLRERGSAESKAVTAAHGETGK